MSERRIRKATPEDAAAIAGIHARGWQWGYRGLLPAEFLATLTAAEGVTRWSERLADPSRRTWLVEDASGAVAFLACGPSREEDVPAGSGEVYALYEEEFAAGTGAARALMTHAVDALRIGGAQLAVLWVLAENTRARRFYEAAGWRADGKTKTVEHRAGLLREVRYGRSIP